MGLAKPSWPGSRQVFSGAIVPFSTAFACLPRALFFPAMAARNCAWRLRIPVGRGGGAAIGKSWLAGASLPPDDRSLGQPGSCALWLV